LRGARRLRSRVGRPVGTTTATAATAAANARRRIRRGAVVGAGRLSGRRVRFDRGVPQVQSADRSGPGPGQAHCGVGGRRRAVRPGRQVHVRGRRRAGREGRAGRHGLGPGPEERPAGRHARQPDGQARVYQDDRAGRTSRPRR